MFINNAKIIGTGIDPEWIKSKCVIDEQTGCWSWGRSLFKNGYGKINLKGGVSFIHRLMYVLANGGIEEGKYILHTCDNRKCCNPAHLFAGTQKDNIRDMISKGRGFHPSLKGEANGQSKLKEEDVIFMLRSKATGVYLAKKFNITTSMISLIRRNKKWRHIKRCQ